jgi:hypothetical protein
MTVLIPARFAANIFSLTPPIGKILPLKVSSPVTAVFLQAGFLDIPTPEPAIIESGGSLGIIGGRPRKRQCFDRAQHRFACGRRRAESYCKKCEKRNIINYSHPANGL